MPTLMENIPAELRGLQRWVCAAAGSKAPMQAFGPGAASVGNPGTWGSFEDALECVEGGVYEYAGFVFADDGYVGIDIDRAFGEDGLPSPEALAAVEACTSYTEVSRSGNGLHIICRGTLPFRGRNNGAGWEIYKDGRYFVLTGRVAGAGVLADAQDGIDAVLARHFAERAPGGSAAAGGRRRIWEPRWELPHDGLVMVEPARDEVAEGGRHMAMVSLCGQLRAHLAHPQTVLKEALAANARYMRPPLPEEEVRSIAASVQRYRR
jgi:hypothetical protein